MQGYGNCFIFLGLHPLVLTDTKSFSCLHCTGWFLLFCPDDCTCFVFLLVVVLLLFGIAAHAHVEFLFWCNFPFCSMLRVVVVFGVFPAASTHAVCCYWCLLFLLHLSAIFCFLPLVPLNFLSFNTFRSSPWRNSLWNVSTFTQVFSPRPDCTFVEFMAWSLFGFPSGPLPVYVPFSTKETAETAGIMTSLAITQNITGPTVLPLSVARSWNQWLQQLAPRFNCPMASLAIAGHRLPSLPIFWTML